MAPRDGEGTPARRALVALLALLLAAAVGTLYARTAAHAYVTYDDGAYVTENPRVAGGLTWENARWAFLGFHSGNWHPLTTLSHQLDVELFGLEPGPHHAVNVALHALNAVLCCAFFLGATGAPWASLLVALLFALHPLRVESVAWVAERKDVLAGTFFFLTLLAHGRAVARPSRGRRALVALALALGLLAKPMLVTVPLVLLLVDVWPLGRVGPAGGPALAARVREKLPLFALAVASAGITLVAQRAGGALQPLELLSLPVRLATAVLGTGQYLAKALWPVDLAVFYPHPALIPAAGFAPLGWRPVLTAAGLGLATVLLWRLRRRAPMLWVGWAWFGVMLLPVVGLVQVGTQLCADRYTYLPLLGPTAALVFGARAALAPRLRPAGFGLGLLAAALLARASHRQLAHWRDSRTLFEHALAVTPMNYVAHEHLGLHFQRQGDLARAAEHYRAALALVPILVGSRGNLGAILVERGELAAAREQFELLERHHPGEPQALLGLAALALRERRPEEVLRLLASFGPERPGYALAQLDLAEAHEALGQWAEALECYRRAFAVGPPDPAAAAAAAWILATGPDPALLDGEGALALAGYAAQGGAANGLELLAAAHARRGDFGEAVRLQEEALRQTLDPVQRFLLEQRLRLFRAGKPYTRSR